MKTIALSLLLAAVSAGFAPEALAQSKPAATKFYVDVKGHMTSVDGSTEATLTFDQAVQVPKATLPPGSYLFTMVSPNIMRVSSEDGKKVFTTFNTSSAVRSSAKTRDLKHAQVRFERVDNGASIRLIGIYLEGTSQGYAPLYPKSSKPANAPVATSGTVGGK